MSQTVCNFLTPRLLEASDSLARWRLQSRQGTDLLEVTGQLQGPHCDGRRTLPATFPLRKVSAESEQAGSAEVLVTEPCYWTPAQPFVYQLDVTVRTGDGAQHTFSTRIGLRRWTAEGRNLLLERRRTVLRGVRVDAIQVEQLAEAREAELVLLTSDLDSHLCEEASRLGVGLIADLCGAGAGLAKQLARLQWYPAVLVALLKAGQLPVGTRDLLLAQYESQSPGARTPRLAPGADLLAVELNPGEHPPAWVPRGNIPAIALLRSHSEVPLATARAACDRLQAELAPHSDLAGYIV